MSDIYLLRFVMHNGHTIEGYFKSELAAAGKHKEAVAAQTKAAKAASAEKPPPAPYTMMDDYGIACTIDLLACAAIIRTDTDASAAARVAVEEANRRAGIRHGGAVSAGFRPPPGSVVGVPSQ